MTFIEQKDKIDIAFKKVSDSIELRAKKVSNEYQLNAFANETIKEFQELLPFSVGFYIFDDISKAESIELHNHSVEKSYIVHKLYSKFWREKFNEIKE